MKAPPQETPLALAPEERTALMVQLEQSICSLSGLQTKEVAMQVTAILGNMQFWSQPKTTNEGLLMAIALLTELRPQSHLEALLAVQMVGTFQAGTKLLASSLEAGQTLEHVEWKMRAATDLMRLYTEQLEAMAKLKGKSTQQKVIVEHVHVYEGGQAIVGAVQGSGSRTRERGAGDDTQH